MGNNWNIPTIWAPVLRYISAPILAIIFSFSYPDFYQSRMDPLQILGFTISHAALIMVGLGYILPAWFDPIVPGHRRLEGDVPTASGVNNSVVEAQLDDVVETGLAGSEEGSDKGSDVEERKKSGVLDGEGAVLEGQGSGQRMEKPLRGLEEKTVR
jgi:solute carrier family 6 GABA transporter-like protein 1